MARFAPGERLKSQDLCGRYGASVSVVREALSALATERFVRFQPRHGYTVAPLTEDDLIDLTTARLTVEGAALRESVRAGGVDWEADVVAAHHRLAALSSGPATESNIEQWHRAHETFHVALLAACPSRRLRESAQVMRAEAELYRRWMLKFGAPREGDVAAEHRQLVDLALAGDAERAEELIQTHMQRTSDALVRGLRDRIELRDPGVGALAARA